MIRVGIIGAGAIGSELGRRIQKKFKKYARVRAVSDIDAGRAGRLRKELKIRRRHTTASLIRECDLVIEAASAAASASIAEAVLRQGKKAVLLSAGGVLSKGEHLRRLAERHGGEIHIPSGALCGVDGILSGSCGRIRRVGITTRKNPRGFTGVPWVVKHGIDLERLRKETVLFDGTAEEAVRGFPQNINVSATLSLAGIGPRRTRVRIIAVPGLEMNEHEVRAEGDFGVLVARSSNRPSPDNPRTSLLAVLSAEAVLRKILSPIKIGN